MRLALASAVAILSACGPSAEALEAARLLHAIDALRDVPNDPVTARKALLDQLDAEPASGKLAAAARSACITAYRPMVEGQMLEARVRARHRAAPEDIQPDLLVDLATAEAKLKESKAAMPECERTKAELRRTFR